MSKKLKIPFIFKNKEAKQPWKCPSCTRPKTLSFRASDDDDVVSNITTINHATPKSLSINFSRCASFSTAELSEEIQSVEMTITGVRLSERLFFNPNDTSSIMKEDAIGISSPFKKSMVVEIIESDDPYLDFKKSMQEMVQSQGLKDWDCLLGCYLRINGEINHEFIVGSFLDLLIELASSEHTTRLCSGSTSFSSAVSSFPSPSSPLITNR
ncbi:hypothetical protein BUALT_Bualt01G0122200 [Buddleja alternifolia]|uniref:Transcription repressor n=1 Tax=Buddleja alternifolia TaxID=168488 RepID=A0AAV6Y7F9_9LAMI|nr:hypothetical protein BUALT_Bualt01G0122200 [Buddleja alternifolia]